MWSAAITSVIGAAYTSVSFLKTFHPKIESNDKYVIVAFIIFTTIVFLLVGNPVKTLVFAGTLNGFILPVGLSLILLASRRREIVGEVYRHPIWLQIAGWFVVAIMLAFSIQTLILMLKF
jgi:Mn2+/Fe2+ NRAMP family transporter